MSETSIERLVHELSSRTASLEKIILANGRPGLEERMMSVITAQAIELRRYVDERDEHKMKNMQQALLNMEVLATTRTDEIKSEAHRNGNEIASLRQESDNRHEQNGSRLNSLEARMAYGLGALGVIIPLVQHFWK